MPDEQQYAYDRARNRVKAQEEKKTIPPAPKEEKRRDKKDK